MPITPGEVAADGAAAMAAGVDELHVHPRDGDGRESLAADDVAATLTTLRDIVRAPVSVATSAPSLRDVGERVSAIRRWTVTPDAATVNFGVPGAVEVAQALLDRSVGVQAGLPTTAAAELLVGSRVASRCQLILIEPREQDLPAARLTIQAIEDALDGAATGVPRLLHGVEATAWDLVTEAGRLGYDIRMGFEDTLRTPGGMIARDNGELIRTAVALHRRAEVASDVIARRPPLAPGARSGPAASGVSPLT